MLSMIVNSSFAKMWNVTNAYNSVVNMLEIAKIKDYKKYFIA